MSLEEVLRIAGGVPVTAALDELSYRSPQEPQLPADERAMRLGTLLRESEPL